MREKPCGDDMCGALGAWRREFCSFWFLWYSLYQIFFISLSFSVYVSFFSQLSFSPSLFLGDGWMLRFVFWILRLFLEKKNVFHAVLLVLEAPHFDHKLLFIYLFFPFSFFLSGKKWFCSHFPWFFFSGKKMRESIFSFFNFISGFGICFFFFFSFSFPW